eukprot:scaffold56120_cov22-Tisochrysis_lutea.AAC.1
MASGLRLPVVPDLRALALQAGGVNGKRVCVPRPWGVTGQKGGQRVLPFWPVPVVLCKLGRFGMLLTVLLLALASGVFWLRGETWAWRCASLLSVYACW